MTQGFLKLLVLIFITILSMAEKPQGQEPVGEEGFQRGLTSEEIMNMNFDTTADDAVRGMTIDEIIERANQGRSGDQGDGTYLVGDIAMTKEDYDKHMAEWEKQKAELIAKGEMQPDK